MSRCQQTDVLLDATFAGTGFTRRQAEHAAACAECARALAHGRRFDSELRAVGTMLVPEPMSAEGETLGDVRAPIERGGLVMWRRGVPAAVVVALTAIAIVIVGTTAWRDAAPFQPLHAGRIAADELEVWLERALAAAHGATNGRGLAADWEPAQVETCGDTAVAFFEKEDERGGNYLWAVGRPGDLVQRSIDTGSSRTLGVLDVAAKRATLPICDVAIGDIGVQLDDTLPALPQRVLNVPGMEWFGDPEDAPVEVEVVGQRGDVVGVGFASDGYLYGVVSEASIRAVDIITADERYRYTVGMPAFVIRADLGGDAVRFELLDDSGTVVAAGPVLEANAGPDADADARAAGHRAMAEAAARAAARAAALAAAERRALEEARLGARCADWRTMTTQEQLAVTEVLVPNLETARVAQQLAAAASAREIIAASRASLDKGCQLSAANRPVADVATSLYGD